MHGCLRLLVTKQTLVLQSQHMTHMFKLQSRHNVVETIKAHIQEKDVQPCVHYVP